MASRKLEKIAREYRINPSTLPPVDGQSVTFNIKQAGATQPAESTPVVETREAQQSEHERLKAEAIATNRRLRDYQRAIRDQRIAARANRGQT